MKYDVQYNDGIFEIKTSADANLEGFKCFWKKLVNHDKWKPSSRILADHTELNAAPLTVEDIKNIADEALKGDRSGQYSIRINDQWRVCFRWEEAGAEYVGIVDYH
jgi:Txe/YoeB family toxin of Txe-Axe toxin-antitoxin module